MKTIAIDVESEEKTLPSGGSGAEGVEVKQTDDNITTNAKSEQMTLPSGSSGGEVVETRRRRKHSGGRRRRRSRSRRGRSRSGGRQVGPKKAPILERKDVRLARLEERKDKVCEEITDCRNKEFKYESKRKNWRTQGMKKQLEFKKVVNDIITLSKEDNPDPKEADRDLVTEKVVNVEEEEEAQSDDEEPTGN